MEELIFKTTVQTGSAAKDVDGVTSSLSNLGKEATKAGAVGSEALANLNAKVEAGGFSMREAAKLVREYGAVALQAGRESPVGQEAIRRAGELSDTIGDLRAEIVNAGRDGANLQAGLQLASTVTAGYGALQGVMALTGSTSEALAETFVKLQAVQSVLTGIEQVRLALEKESILVTKSKLIYNKLVTASEYLYATAVGTSTGAMKVFRLAMLAIPIVAIIAGIAALVAALAAFASKTETAKAENDALNASFDRQNAALEKNERAFKRNSDNKRALMAAQGASARDLLALDNASLEGEEVNRQKNLALLKSSIQQKTKLYAKAVAEDNDELAKSIREESNTQRAKYASLRELDGQYLVDKQLKQLAFNKEASDKAKEASDKALNAAKENAKKQAEAKAKADADASAKQQMLEDLMAANIADADLRALTQLKLQSARELEEVRKKYGVKSAIETELLKKQTTAETTLLAEQLKAKEQAQSEVDATSAKNKADADARDSLNRKSKLEGDLIVLRENAALVDGVKLELATLERDTALAQENITEGEKFKIKQEYVAKKEELDKAAAEREKALQKQTAEAGKQVLTQGLAAAQGLSDAFFGNKLAKAKKGSEEELAIEKKKFEVNKKLQVAQAVMQGVQATLAAFSSGSAIPIVGAVTGPVFAAAAGVTAALNIAKIKNTQFTGGGATSASTGAVPSVPAPDVAPPTQITNVQGTSTLTQGLQGSGSTKVVIVDSEIKAALKGSQQASVISSVS